MVLHWNPSQIMSTAQVPEYVSVDDYLAAEEIATIKSEYIEGWIRAMTGTTNRHNRVKGNCLVNLAVALKGQKCQPFDSDTKVRIRRLGRTRFYYPDLQVVCEGNAPTDVFQDAPFSLWKSFRLRLGCTTWMRSWPHTWRSLRWNATSSWSSTRLMRS